MRPALAPLALLLALPALAQGTERHLYLDVHTFTPSLSGHYTGSSDGNAFNVDLKNDLALERDKTKLGYGIEYQGPRFGVEFSRDEQDYAGNNRVQRNITVNGQTFFANQTVISSFKATNNTFNWTIRPLVWPQFWVGLDLGVRATQVEMSAYADSGLTGIQAAADYKGTLPIPQLGPSLGFTAMDGRVVGKAMYHLLAYRGCTYTHAGADLRVFPWYWLGFRAFVDDEHFRIPKGSIKDDLDITLDRSGLGLGVVARF
jgi:hypothetical protein